MFSSGGAPCLPSGVHSGTIRAAARRGAGAGAALCIGVGAWTVRPAWTDAGRPAGGQGFLWYPSEHEKRVRERGLAAERTATLRAPPSVILCTGRLRLPAPAPDSGSGSGYEGRRVCGPGL